jgi:hypothetical protein
MPEGQLNGCWRMGRMDSELCCGLAGACVLYCFDRAILFETCRVEQHRMAAFQI